MSEERFFGPFTYNEFNKRITVISEKLIELTGDEYNELPLSIRQALEFVYDFLRDKEGQ